MSLNTYSELKKRFVRNYLDVIVLQMFLIEPLWGYRIMSLIREKYNIKIGPPVIYPLLESLQREGLIEFNKNSVGGKKRKIYNITSEGVEKVKKHAAIFKEFLDSSL